MKYNMFQSAFSIKTSNNPKSVKKILMREFGEYGRTLFHKKQNFSIKIQSLRKNIYFKNDRPFMMKMKIQTCICRIRMDSPVV